MTPYTGVRGGSGSLALVSFLSMCPRHLAGHRGVAGALELSHASSELAVETRNGGADLKAEPVLPGQW